MVVQDSDSETETEVRPSKKEKATTKEGSLEMMKLLREIVGIWKDLQAGFSLIAEKMRLHREMIEQSLEGEEKNESESDEEEEDK